MMKHVYKLIVLALFLASPITFAADKDKNKLGLQSSVLNACCDKIKEGMSGGLSAKCKEIFFKTEEGHGTDSTDVPTQKAAKKKKGT